MRKFEASHEVNQPAADECERLAAQVGYAVRHNQTNTGGNFEGYHSYCVYSSREPGDIRWNGGECINYWQTNHSRYSRPGIGGEARCLESMRQWLRMQVDKYVACDVEEGEYD